MEISEEQSQRIIDRAVEKTLLKIPEVIGNIITHHMSLIKLNKDFYDQNPELQKHKQTVATILEQVEGKNPFDDYSELLIKALPKIKEQVSLASGLDMQKLEVPEMVYNGEI